MNEGTEYEVFHPKAPLLAPVKVATYDDAQNVVAQLSKLLGGWDSRAVETGKEPIPPLAEITTSITIHEARQLMAQHGQNVLVMVAWSERTGRCNIVTAGSNREHSEGALKLGEDIALGMNIKGEEKIEDRRSEHPQTDAMLKASDSAGQR